MKDDLDILRLGFSSRNIRELTDLNPEGIKKVVQMKDNLDILGIKIDS